MGINKKGNVGDAGFGVPTIEYFTGIFEKTADDYLIGGPDYDNTKQLFITDIFLSVDTAMRIDISGDVNSNRRIRLYLDANSNVPIITRSILKYGTGERPKVTSSASGNIAAFVQFYQEDA